MVPIQEPLVAEGKHCVYQVLEERRYSGKGRDKKGLIPMNSEISEARFIFKVPLDGYGMSQWALCRFPFMETMPVGKN